MRLLRGSRRSGPISGLLRLWLAALCGLAGLTACRAATPRLVLPPDVEAEDAVTVIRDVRIFDGLEDALSPPSDVLLRNGRIAAIAPGGAQAPAGAVIVEGRGGTLLPGLIDAHVHLGGGDGAPPWAAELPDVEAQAAGLLYCGVTGALTAAHDSDTGALWEDIRRGEVAGPRLWRASRMITAEGGHPVPMFEALVPWVLRGWLLSSRVQEVESPREAARAARDDLEHLRVEFVKVVYDDLPEGAPHLTRPMLQAVVAETAQYPDRRVIVHAGSPQDAVEAAEAGVALLTHVPWRAELDDAQVARLVEAGVPLVTTSRIWRVVADAAHDRLTFDELERRVARFRLEEAFAARPKDFALEGFPPDFFARAEAWDRNLAANLRKLREARVPLLAGTDAGVPGLLHGASLHRELERLVELGFPPAEVLRMATSMPARFLEPAAGIGVIVPGARADLLLIEGDPLEDIRATRKIVAVWQGGRRVERGP